MKYVKIVVIKFSLEMKNENGLTLACVSAGKRLKIKISICSPPRLSDQKSEKCKNSFNGNKGFSSIPGKFH